MQHSIFPLHCIAKLGPQHSMPLVEWECPGEWHMRACSNPGLLMTTWRGPGQQRFCLVHPGQGWPQYFRNQAESNWAKIKWFLPQNEPFLTRVIRSYHSFNRWLLYRAHFVDAGAPLTMATDNNWFPPPPAATCPDILFALLWSVWEVWWLILQLSPTKHVNWAKICIIYVPMPMYIITN